MSKQPEQFGKYILLEQLAQGGMAQIYLAKAPGAGGINKFVAIKRILPQFSDNEEFIRMFKDEAKIVVNLAHSNIVSVNEFGVFDEQFYLAMDYVPGQNLRQILNKMKKKDQQFTIEEVVYIGNLVAAGLDHAHRCLDGSTGKPLNITHRDMSPQNVMISYEGEVKIVDFGIAKAESQIETTRAGTLKGKFGYMSPEQAEGQTVDLRTDIFSLGIVLWEMLANERLFIANNEINTLRKIRDCQVPSLKKFNPNIHPELERIILKSLARDRNMRYHTASGLHRDLNRFLNRQYPDFSPQDFAVHVKTLFADEILKSRKKMMDWAKIPTEAPAHSLNHTQSPNIESNSNDFGQGHPPARQENQEGPDFKTVVTNGEISHVLDDETGGIDQNKTVISTHPHLDTNLTPSEHLNIDSINNGLNKKDSRGFLQGSNEVALHESPQHQGNENQNKKNSRNAPKKKQGIDFLKIAPMVAIVILLLAGAYLLLQPESGSVDNTSLVPNTGDLTNQEYDENPLGDPSTGQTNSYENNTDLTSAPPPQRPIMNPPSVVDIPPTPVVIPLQTGNPCENMDPSNPAYKVVCSKTPANTGELGKLVVQSKPSGAKIFLNGEDTGKTTPAQIDVPRDRAFDLRLDKRSYISYERNKTTLQEFEGQKVTSTLQQAMVAYIDIDVMPPVNAKVRVNGVALDEARLPIRGYAIPANQQIVVEAYNPYTKKAARQTIKLQNKKKAFVQLRLSSKRKTSGKRN